MKKSTFVRAAAVLVAGACLCSCTREMRKESHLRKADHYFANGNYDAAEIEYLNAARMDTHDPHAVSQLGILYFSEGRIGKAYEFLSGAKHLDPNNLEARLDLGLCMLAAGHKVDAAREATFLLERDPSSVMAPLLLAESAENAAQIAAFQKRIEALPQGAPRLVALATLELQRSRVQHAKSLLESALKADPQSATAATGLGTIYWEEKNLPLAKTYFAKAAGLSPVRSGKRMQFAQFCIRTGDSEGARKLLDTVLAQAPDYLPAGMMLAELDESEHKFDAAEATVRNVIARDPAFPGALLLNGRIELAKGDPARAASIFEYGLTFYPRNPVLEYELAQAYLGSGANGKAETALNLTMAWAPDFIEAAISLAQLDERKGDYSSEIALLTQAVQKRPDAGSAWLMLANAYANMNDFDDALGIYRRLAAANPHASQPLALEGIVLAHDGRYDAAEAAFIASLKLSPGNPTVMEQLVQLYVSEGKFDAARKWLVDGLRQNPKAPGPLYVLLARVALAQNKFDEGERQLKEAIAVQPDSADAYFLLAEVYYTTKRDRQALADLQKVVAADPKRTQALMLMGSIEMAEKRYAEARASYEKALAVDPEFSPALNNLAYLYSEQFGDLDRALEMAQETRKLLPDDPHVEDTLGWVLYRKHEYAWALSLLQDAASNLSGDPEAQFHLGMTQYMLGQEDRARQSLQNSVKGGDFPGLDEARRRLTILAVNVNTAGPSETALLEKSHEDPVALARLAAIYERDGAVDKAMSTCNAALAINPHDLPALTRLSHLYESKGDLDKAYEMAKAAHGFAPSDPEASLALGRLAFRLGNYAWSDSVLADAAALRPNDPEIRYQLALAEYSLGRVDLALQDMDRAHHNSQSSRHLLEEERFVRLVSAGAGSAAPDPSVVAEAHAVLAKDPHDVPALMVDAEALAAEGKEPDAVHRWTMVLDQYPRFAPAARKLAMAYAAHPVDTDHMTHAALLAREGYPDDPDVAKACGIIAYREGENERADELLQDSAAVRNSDAEVFYYLGMAELKLKKHSALDALKRSLQLNLSPEMASDVRKALANSKL